MNFLKKKKCKKDKKKKKKAASDYIQPGLSLVSAGLLVSAALNKETAAWKRIAEAALAAGALRSAAKGFLKKDEEE